MIDDGNLLPEIRVIDNYIGVIEFLVQKLASDTDVSFLSSDFYLKIIALRDCVRELKNSYINSLKFQSYE